MYSIPALLLHTQDSVNKSNFICSYIYKKWKVIDKVQSPGVVTYVRCVLFRRGILSREPWRE